MINSGTYFYHFYFQCYEKYNKPLPDGSIREYPLCAVQLKDTMSGAKDAKTCYRRTQVPTNLNPDTYCDPLGDHNVIATIKAVPNQDVYPNKSVIVAAARVSFFHDLINPKLKVLLINPKKIFKKSNSLKTKFYPSLQVKLLIMMLQLCHHNLQILLKFHFYPQLQSTKYIEFGNFSISMWEPTATL